MDSQTTELFYVIAQIAGIFIGFGALISLSRDRQQASAELFLVRAVVTMGLFVLIGALIPITLNAYGVAADILWRVSGLIMFIFNAVSIYVQFAPADIRKAYARRMRANWLGSIFFWLGMEGSSQLLMVLLIIGVYGTLADAFYATVLIINLFQAAYLLASLVYGRDDQEGPSKLI